MCFCLSVYPFRDAFPAQPGFDGQLTCKERLIPQTPSLSSRRTVVVAVLALCLLAFTQAALSQTFNFTKVVDTNTPVPGGGGDTFEALFAPSVHGGNVAFLAWGPDDVRGIYTSIDGTLSLVADDNTVISADSTIFQRVYDPSFDGTSVAFRALASDAPVLTSREGIYSNTGGSLHAMARIFQTIPGGLGVIGSVGAASLDSGNATFISLNSDDAILKVSGGVLSVVAGKNTIVPGTPLPEYGYLGNPFSNIGFASRPAISGQNVIFKGRGSPSNFPDGIYAEINGSLVVISDNNGNFPPGVTYAAYGDVVDISGSNAVFLNENPANQRGVFTNIAGTQAAVATVNDVVPGTAVNFTNFQNPSIDGESVVFIGETDSIANAIYTNIGGALQKVIGIGDALDGQGVTHVGLKPADAFNAGIIGFIARLTDGTYGIFTAGVFLDGDSDGIGDDVDNCPGDPNPLQEDSDADGVGSICDVCPADPADGCNTDGSGAIEVTVEGGGLLITPSGDVTVTIPPGSVDQNSTVSVTQLANPLNSSDLIIWPHLYMGRPLLLFDLEPEGMTFDPRSTLLVSVDVTHMSRRQIERLDLYVENDSGQYLALNAVCSVNEPPTPIIADCTVMLDHFSTYALIAPADTDSDGVFDAYEEEVDNCPDDYNPGQEDHNSDGLGNLCDPEFIFGDGFELPVLPEAPGDLER